MNDDYSNNIAFLFGAGISQDSLISTADLTTKIVETKNIARIGGGYIEHENPSVFADIDVRDYLSRIKNAIA